MKLVALALVLAVAAVPALAEPSSTTGYDPIPSIGDREIPLDMSKVKVVRQYSATGYIFAIAGLGAMVGSWIAYFLDVGKKGGDLSPYWIGLMGGWGGSAAIGVPLLLAAEYKTRKMLGLPGVDGYFIAGAMFLGIGYASLAFIDVQPVYTMLYATIGYTASVLWSWWGAGRALRKLKRMQDAQGKEHALLVPFASPLPGGAVAGLAGSF
jgi:hypothetical protein